MWQVAAVLDRASVEDHNQIKALRYLFLVTMPLAAWLPLTTRVGVCPS